MSVMLLTKSGTDIWASTLLNTLTFLCFHSDQQIATTRVSKAFLSLARTSALVLLHHSAKVLVWTGRCSTKPAVVKQLCHVSRSHIRIASAHAQCFPPLAGRCNTVMEHLAGHALVFTVSRVCSVLENADLPSCLCNQQSFANLAILPGK